ncbi:MULTISPECIES: hypothetical protein [Gordonia]|uniref:Predicted membrane protein n=1 Tax=Gordonia paraffinivorans TaxID=175628 RepID=A0ABD7V2P1_9ACTN|nr:hypothetical protein [Gordonia paraffinivorans]MCD2144988.1 hypothetical protein [Gordonia paraffinivorans]VFA88475.1 Predicted membrane protein [Gordonia paraffinivorans]
MHIRSRRRVADQIVRGRTPRRPVVIRARSADSASARLVGIGLAGSGLAHFTSPRLFEPITRPVFPRGTRAWVFANGTTETVLGLAIAGRRTRTIGAAGTIAYVAFLAGHALARATPRVPEDSERTNDDTGE